MPPDDADNGAEAPSIRSGNGKGKVQLLTRGNIDGRCRAAQQFDSIVRAIADDLGGEDQLSTVQKHLVEAFAGSALVVNSLNVHTMIDGKVDLVEYSAAVSTMVRLASRIGVSRMARNAGPLHDRIMDEPTLIDGEVAADA